MALSCIRVNRIFTKACLGIQIRRANRSEQRMNKYGEQDKWVLDNGEYQALAGYTTLNDAIAAALEVRWETWNAQRSWEKLTEAELTELRAILSQISPYL